MGHRREHQMKFSQMMAKLIIFIDEEGYGVVTGEVQRSKEQAKANALNKVGIAKSLHVLCMAVDLSLISPDGVYLTDSDDYAVFGIFWESLGGAWGGRFSRPDGNHFSLPYPYEGYKGIR